MPGVVFGNLGIYVEVPVFLLFFAFSISGPISSNLIIYRTCYVIFDNNRTECALLGTQNQSDNITKLEKDVQPYSALISMVSLLIQSLTSALFCLFAGSWSDRFGRKPVLILPVIGQLVSYILTIVYCVIEMASPWYLLLCSIPVALTGGTPTYLAVAICYITDLTDERNRGMRMALFEAAIFSGIFLGTVASSYIYNATNYSAVFVLSAVCCLLNFLLTLFFVSESLTNNEFEGRLHGFFRLSNVADMVKIIFKKRENYVRCIIISCVVMTMLAFLTTNGNDSVMSLYLRENFHWPLQKYTLFTAAYNVIPVIGTVLGVYILHKRFQIPETVLLLLSLMSSLCGVLLMAFAQTEWTVYSAAIVRIFAGIFPPMLQLLVTKIVPIDEIGKIVSLVIATQFLLSLAGSPLYTVIYDSTINRNPAMYNFVSAGIYIALIMIAAGIVAVKRMTDARNDYLLINEDLGQHSSDIRT